MAPSRLGVSPWLRLPIRLRVEWDKKLWPIKPDIVFEGGNLAASQNNTIWDTPDDLQLLTTHPQVTLSAFTTIGDTSAATALAARFAAELQYHFPDYWPETIRALMVHSAEWTETMKDKLSKAKTKTDKLALLRMYGFGVPDMNRALWSARNRFNLIIQDQIVPFELGGVMKDMRFYALPWPKIVLESIGIQNVRLRVTLSYFIDGNPSHRGYKGKYSYASHGLRFHLKRPYETVQNFLARISKAQQKESDEKSKSIGWTFGEQSHTNGSLHADIWNGSGQDLANCGFIAIHPTVGWWKERETYQGKEVRYALIISLETDAEKVDLYTPVKLLVDNKIPTPVAITTR
ncbi:MAG: S8 family serine peptidase [Magnetococcales bacterium]|nr:S8 family serine peptidase [Magnetococcales bacterium]MBF0437868.1 S8 family serine peptidase [Magnetococcales bacterium]